MTNVTYTTPEVFDALRMKVTRGRGFLGSDGPNTEKTMVVNEAFVRRYLGNQNPIGTHVRMKDDWDIVGVVGDVQQKNSFNQALGPIATSPQVYIPAAQVNDGFVQMAHTWFSPSWVVRTRGPVNGLTAQMQKAITAVDPLTPFSKFEEMTGIRNETLQRERYRTFLFSILAGIAVLLAAIGVYGLIAQSIAQRTRELGIRLALGAGMERIVRSAAAPGLKLALGGVMAGLVGAVFATRLLKGMLWGVTSGDPMTYVAVAVGLLVVAGLACLAPAMRLLRLDPARVLREE